MIKVQEFHKDYTRWAWQINDNISYAEDIVLFKLDAKNTSYVFGATDDGYLIVDVGGDDAGALALGRYAEAFKKFADKIEMDYVVNCRRFLTQTADEALVLMGEIEMAANMKHTAIVNNTNLLYETTKEVLEDSVGFAEEIAEKAGLPLAFTCVPLKLDADVPKPLPVEIYVKKIWEVT